MLNLTKPNTKPSSGDTAQDAEPGPDLARRGVFGAAVALAAAPVLAAAATPQPDAGLIRLARAYEGLQHDWYAAGVYHLPDSHPAARAGSARQDVIAQQQDDVLGGMLDMTPCSLDGLGAVAAALAAFDQTLFRTDGYSDHGGYLLAMLLRGVLEMTEQGAKAGPMVLLQPMEAFEPPAHLDAELMAVRDQATILRGQWDRMNDESCVLPIGSSRETELHEAMVALVPGMRALDDQVIATPARTLPGLHAKADVLRLRLGGMVGATEPMDPDNALSWSLMEDVLQVAGSGS